MNKKKNISFVVSNGLCISCGMCYSVCPVNAIYFKDSVEKEPIVKNNCIKCKKCLLTCPGIYPLKSIEPNFNKLLGKIKNCYIGFSVDKKIRKSSSSGGIITSLNIEFLKNGFDGIICIRQSKNNIMRNEVILAKTKKDILSAQGSRYAPAFVCKGLKDLNLKKNKKYVFIGRPCDIQALKKSPYYEKSNFFTIAFFCARTPKMAATKHVFTKYKIDINQIYKFQYRGNGWPGFFSIYSNNDSIIFKKNYLEIWNNYLCKLKFLNKRCYFCSDCTGELADLSVGDAWIDSLRNGNDGYSIVISRTTSADKILKKCIEKQIIEVETITQEKVIKSQKSLLLKKKNKFLKKLIGLLFFEKMPLERISFDLNLFDIKELFGIIKIIIYYKFKCK